MSYDETGPEARIRCLLSKQGIVDAVRHGISVESTNVAVFWVQEHQDDWEKVFALDPEPIFDEYGFSRMVHLDIARSRVAEVRPSKPGMVRYFFEPEIEAWTRPTVVTTYGAQEFLDSCEGIHQVLDYETRLVEEFLPVLAECEASELPKVLDAWREWSATEGLENARKLLELATRYAEEAAAIKLPRFWEVRQLGRELQTAIEIAMARRTDEAFTALAEEVYATGEAVEELEDRITKEKARQAEQQQAEEWVRAHGSARLKKALEAQLLAKSMGAYRDERLDHERPGWQWSKEPKAFKDIVNPDEDNLDALLEARQVDPEVRLVFDQQAGPLLIATFLGRYISKPAVPEPTSGYGYSEEPF